MSHRGHTRNKVSNADFEAVTVNSQCEEDEQVARALEAFIASNIAYANAILESGEVAVQAAVCFQDEIYDPGVDLIRLRRHKSF